jgi:hypothetical protein
MDDESDLSRRGGQWGEIKLACKEREVFALTRKEYSSCR